MLELFIDADACPVKQEIYRVAKRYQLSVCLVSNTPMRIPAQSGVKLMVVSGQFDAADDWIVEHVAENDIVITADIPLASRCVKKKARVLTPAGHEYSDDNMGAALATRDLLAELRGMGAMLGGPAPFAKHNRSCFLQRLDEIIQSIRRTSPQLSK
jgi:uncharacterized protein